MTGQVQTSAQLPVPVPVPVPVPGSVPGQTVRRAWEKALYGPVGRFTLGVRDFATALTDPVTTPVMAGALRALAHRTDDALGRPDPFDVVDVGAGTGSFLATLAADLPARWRLTGVERAPRPPGLPAVVAWDAEPPAGVRGFLLAHELLDDVPCEVLRDGRLLLADGAAGPPPDPADRAWLEEWWPGWERGEAESGLARDRTWARLVSGLGRGLALAVDYAHDRGTRRPTLTGYRDGRQVEPTLDGSCDVTAHVAMDSLIGQWSTQRECLQELGVSGRLPAVPELPGGGYAARLMAANAAATLLDPAGYGGFGWVLAHVGIEPVLARA